MNIIFEGFKQWNCLLLFVQATFVLGNILQCETELESIREPDLLVYEECNDVFDLGGIWSSAGCVNGKPSWNKGDYRLLYAEPGKDNFPSSLSARWIIHVFNEQDDHRINDYSKYHARFISDGKEQYPPSGQWWTYCHGHWEWKEWTFEYSLGEEMVCRFEPIRPEECPSDVNLARCGESMKTGEMCEADRADSFQVGYSHNVENCGAYDVFRFTCDDYPTQICDFSPIHYDDCPCQDDAHKCNFRECDYMPDENHLNYEHGDLCEGDKALNGFDNCPGGYDVHIYQCVDVDGFGCSQGTCGESQAAYNTVPDSNCEACAQMCRDDSSKCGSFTCSNWSRDLGCRLYGKNQCQYSEINPLRGIGHYHTCVELVKIGHGSSDKAKVDHFMIQQMWVFFKKVMSVGAEELYATDVVQNTVIPEFNRWIKEPIQRRGREFLYRFIREPDQTGYSLLTENGETPWGITDVVKLPSGKELITCTFSMGALPLAQVMGLAEPEEKEGISKWLSIAKGTECVVEMLLGMFGKTVLMPIYKVTITVIEIIVNAALGHGTEAILGVATAWAAIATTAMLAEGVGAVTAVGAPALVLVAIAAAGKAAAGYISDNHEHRITISNFGELDVYFDCLSPQSYWVFDPLSFPDYSYYCASTGLIYMDWHHLVNPTKIEAYDRKDEQYANIQNDVEFDNDRNRKWSLGIPRSVYINRGTDKDLMVTSSVHLYVASGGDVMNNMWTSSKAYFKTSFRLVGVDHNGDIKKSWLIYLQNSGGLMDFSIRESDGNGAGRHHEAEGVRHFGQLGDFDAHRGEENAMTDGGAKMWWVPKARATDERELPTTYITVGNV